MYPPNVMLDWDDKGLFADFIASLMQKYPYQRPTSCKEAYAWFLEIYELVGGK